MHFSICLTQCILHHKWHHNRDNFSNKCSYKGYILSQMFPQNLFIITNVPTRPILHHKCSYKVYASSQMFPYSVCFISNSSQSVDASSQMFLQLSFFSLIDFSCTNLILSLYQNKMLKLFLYKVLMSFFVDKGN